MRRPVVLVHAGAGDAHSEQLEREAISSDALARALHAAAEAIERRAGAVEAVVAAVKVMEAFELFNAGVGSSPCADGSIEMSAAVMQGSDRAAGAVALVRRVEHPVLAARALLEQPEVLMVGAAAEERAAAQGMALSDGAVATPRQLERLRQLTAEREARGREWHEHGTVGAVCLDGDGLLAAATSTGGRLGQPPGRVGDTPLIGAGTWADRRAAISCTGQGEAFVRAGAARHLAALVEQGVALEAAARTVLEEVDACGGAGGLIALDSEGEAAMPFSAEVMLRGRWRAGEDFEVMGR